MKKTKKDSVERSKKNNLVKCGLCIHLINIDKDSYSKLTDYHLGEFYRAGFYHTRCYVEMIKGTKAMQKTALNLLTKINKEMDGRGEKEILLE